MLKTKIQNTAKNKTFLFYTLVNIYLLDLNNQTCHWKYIYCNLSEKVWSWIYMKSRERSKQVNKCFQHSNFVVNKLFNKNILTFLLVVFYWKTTFSTSNSENLFSTNYIRFVLFLKLILLFWSTRDPRGNPRWHLLQDTFWNIQIGYHAFPMKMLWRKYASKVKVVQIRSLVFCIYFPGGCIELNWIYPSMCTYWKWLEQDELNHDVGIEYALNGQNLFGKVRTSGRKDSRKKGKTLLNLPYGELFGWMNVDKNFACEVVKCSEEWRVKKKPVNKGNVVLGYICILSMHIHPLRWE